MKAIFETIKFVLRIGLLVAGPQLIALATNNEGVLWADLLSVILPVVDKYIHASPLKANGLLPF